MNPLVSVVIPAYNAAETIGRALDSVLAQTYKPLEIIVIDDGSKDSTATVVDSYSKHGIDLIKLDKNQGAAAARNAGIERAAGKFVAFLDSDDEWLPDKTARQIEVISYAPNMSFIACAAEFVSPDPHAPKRVHEGRKVVTGPDAWKALLAYPFVATPSVLARHAKLTECGAFCPSLMVAEDQDLWIRLARTGDTGYVDETLARVYDHPGSLMKRHTIEGIYVTLNMVRKHLNQWRDELTARERRRILSHRYTSLGRNAYVNGETLFGAKMLFCALGLGNAVPENLGYLLTASPPMRSLKSRILTLIARRLLA